MFRKNRLFILLILLAAMLFTIAAPVLADEELHTDRVKLYNQGEFPEPSVARYSLKGVQFDAYMRENLAAQKYSIDVSQFRMSREEFYSAYQDLLNRTPSLFYVYGGYSYYSSNGIVTSVLPTYLYTGSDLAERIAKFEASVNEVVAYARQSNTIEGQLLRANDYLCANYEYDTSYSIYSPDEFFENKTGVCQAYTLAYGAVLDKLGISWVTALSDAMNHIWNMVNINDDWYHIDVTWNDPVSDVPLRACHNNFLLSDTGIEVSGHYSWVCTVDATNTKYDNYFWRSIKQVLPMLGDTTYYIQTPSTFHDRSIYKFDLKTKAFNKVHDFKFTGSTYYTDYYPVWVDNTFLYYVDDYKLYRVPHSGGSATLVYNAGSTDKRIWGMFQNGTTLSMYLAPSPTPGGSIHTLKINSNMPLPVKITQQPVSVTVAKGKEAHVSFTASGDGLTYKWYYKDKSASSFKYTSTFSGNTYSAIMTDARAGRQIYCVVTDKYGNTAKTDTVTLNMAQPVKITDQPVSVAVPKGQTAIVSFTATGDGLTYKWYYKDKSSSSFKYTSTFSGNTYSALMTDARADRQIYCVVTDKYGNTAKTDTVTLSIAQPLKITKQPVSVSVPKGQTAIVSFTATGDGLTYKWYYKDKSSSSFKYTSTFSGNTYSALMTDARADRQIYCVVTDKYGNTVKTNTVTLSIASSLKITKQPVSVSVPKGSVAKVSFTATGNGLTYKWYFKNRDDDRFRYTSTFTGNTYEVQMEAARAGRQIYCVVTDKSGASVTTNTVTLNMDGSVQITKQPVSVSVPKGAIAKVSFTATGDGLTYKWYYKNKTSTRFLLTDSFDSNTYSVSMSDGRAGRQIYCVVTDKYGISAKTNTVTLSMSSAPKASAGTDDDSVLKLAIDSSFEDADIPQALRDAGYASVSAIQSALSQRLGKTATDAVGAKLYNVSLLYSEDDGKTWGAAVPELFAEDGKILVTMPVPDGSDPISHTYAVSHMFESDAFGQKAGDIETPAVSVVYSEKGEPMLAFETTGLSPILVVWNTQTPQTALPQTGDNSHLGLYAAVMLLSLAGIWSMLHARRKQRS